MADDLFSLSGRTALVFGGKRGLGYAMAEAFAQAGADVALVSRDSRRLEEAARAIEQSTGRRAIPLGGDVRDAEQVEDVVRQTADAFGKIDIVVNSAGINVRKSIGELTADEWRDVIDTNLTSAFYICKAIEPYMKQARFGRVINVGSLLSNFGIPGRTPYASSKGGIVQFTRTLALEWAEFGITVNAICPGFFATELNAPVIEDPVAYEGLRSKIPLGRFGSPEEIKTAALFLASPHSSYVTGSCLFIDGGVSAEA